jgi:hypothetical protein
MLSAEPKHGTFDVANSSHGRERWSAADLTPIWDGRLLVLERR